jgi:hypothetical protein
MSEQEDPVSTVLRLLTTSIQVTKDNGDPATVLATREHYDREILKDADAQVTVALDSSQDQKLELAGRLRRQVMAFRCNIYTVDKTASGSDPGKVMRDKVTAQINAVIRENRNLPNQTTLDFDGVETPSESHKAFSAGSASELAPFDALWTELSDYEGIWASDDVRYQKSHGVNGECALVLFRFKISARERCVKKITLSFEGYATAPAGNGATIKAWNHSASAWQLAQAGSSGGDQTLTIAISANLPDFIDGEGYVWLLARTTNPSNGSTPAVLYCDFVQCVFQVNGLSFLDVVGYRFFDVTEVKPYLYRCESQLRGWLFESLGT